MAYNCVLDELDGCESSVPRDLINKLFNIKNDANAYYRCTEVANQAAIEQNVV